MRWQVYDKRTNECVHTLNAINYPAARRELPSQYHDVDAFGLRIETEDHREITRLRAEVERLKREAATARAEEREACAKLCEKSAVEASSIGALAGIGASWAADAIRARSTVGGAS